MPKIVVKLLVFDDKRPVIVDFLKKFSSFVFVNAQQIQKSLYLQSKRRGGIKMFSFIFNKGNKSTLASSHIIRKRRVVADECFDKIVTEMFVKFLSSPKRAIN